MRGNEILGEEIHTQRESMMFGGILPPVAQASHRRNIERVVSESLRKANARFEELDAIAVTSRPGLKVSLTVGLRYAKHLSRKYQKPLIPIHHMEAHALAARIDNDVQFPFLCLLVSGGHSLLAVVEDVDQFLLIGDTIDDAPGEAFDKIARRLKLRNIPNYENINGGQAIEEAARLCNKPTDKYLFPFMMSRYRDCQFSFAGMKNIAKRHIMLQEKILQLEADEVIPDFPDFCANFLGASTRHICNRTQRAIEFCEKKGLMNGVDKKSLVVAGGVACNDFIFNALAELCAKLNYQAVRPSKKLCTDNGIMIAWNGVERFNQNKGICSPEAIDNIEPLASCQLGKSLIDQVKEENIKCEWVKISSLKPFMRPA